MIQDWTFIWKSSLDVLCWGVPGKGTMASVRLDARHFSFSLNAPLVPFKLLPWCWSSEGVSLSVCVWVLEKKLLGTPEVSSTDSFPTAFYSQKLWGLTFLSLEPWAGGPGVGQGLLGPEIFLLNFYLPQVGVGPPHSMPASLPPVWMDVVSLIPQLSDFHSARLLMVLSDG